MTREEIVKALRVCSSDTPCINCPAMGREPKLRCTDYAMMCAADMLEQDVPGWISVKDRLPESGEKVIARLQSRTFQIHWTTTILAHIGEHEKTTDDDDWRDCECDTEYDEKNDCYWISECWYEVNVIDDNPNWIIDSDYNVTHWMPLPTFPTEKEETK